MRARCTVMHSWLVPVPTKHTNAQSRTMPRANATPLPAPCDTKYATPRPTPRNRTRAPVPATKHTPAGRKNTGNRGTLN